MWSATLRPAGMKKLVHATRAKSNRKQTGIRTAKARRAMQDVMNHAQVTIGIRERVMPLVRRSRVVAMKFNDPNSDAIQNTKIEIPQRLWPIACPGPASLPTALSGA